MDIDGLLKPITEGNPVGPYLRNVPGDQTHEQIQDLRTEYDEATSPSGMAKEADWRGVVRVCTETLASRSKDLEFVSALTEALARVEGYGGLRSGLQLALSLLERYWRKLHPGQDGGGSLNLAVHMKPLSVLGAGNVLGAVERIPICQVPGKDPLGWHEFLMARRRGGVDEASRLADQGRYKEFLATGFVTSSDWKAALASTPGDILRTTLTELDGCRQVLGKLTQFLNSKTDAEKTPTESERIPVDDLPNLMPLRDLLDEIHGVVTGVAGSSDSGGSVDSAADGVGESAGAAPSGGSGGGAKGPVSSRADAFRQLQEVAEYLRRTEPHSPVAYLVQRAVRWGAMPLEEVLREVVKDGGALQKIQETLGLESEDS
jgi:type VI secretion system protein ImpA